MKNKRLEPACRSDTWTVVLGQERKQVQEIAPLSSSANIRKIKLGSSHGLVLGHWLFLILESQSNLYYLLSNYDWKSNISNKINICIRLMTYQVFNSPYSKFLALGSTCELYQMQNQSWCGFIFRYLNCNPLLPCFLILYIPIYTHLSLEQSLYNSNPHGGICELVSWKGEKKPSTLISQARHTKLF